jgi:hypothetical protein
MQHNGPPFSTLTVHVCTSEQRSARMRRTVPFMQLPQRNATVAAMWIMASGLIGFAGNVTSIGGASLVLGFGLVPPIIMMLHWSTPMFERVRRTHP